MNFTTLPSLYFKVLSRTAVPSSVVVQTVPKVPVLSWPMGPTSILKLAIPTTSQFGRGPKLKKKRGPTRQIQDRGAQLGNSTFRMGPKAAKNIIDNERGPTRKNAL